MKYHPYCFRILTYSRETGWGTMPGGQFDWGGYLEKVGSMVGDHHTQNQLYAGKSEHVHILKIGLSENYGTQIISREARNTSPSTTTR